jgi:hypothetical protein
MWLTVNQKMQVTTPVKAAMRLADIAPCTRRLSFGGREIRHKNMRGTTVPMISDRNAAVRHEDQYLD